MQGYTGSGPFENLLIVTGENPRDAGVDYIENALKLARPYFANLTIEVMPLKSEDYFRLTQSGLNGSWYVSRKHTTKQNIKPIILKV